MEKILVGGETLFYLEAGRDEGGTQALFLVLPAFDELGMVKVVVPAREKTARSRDGLIAGVELFQGGS